MTDGEVPVGPAEPPQPAVPIAPTDEELRAACTRWLLGHGRPDPHGLLRQLGSLGDELQVDTYGDGGVVARLEAEVRELLGFPACVFLPSGVMAQQIAVRIHADRTHRQVVGFHPTCHLELHEDKAYQRLHGLVGRTVGDPHALVTLDDLHGVAEPMAAFVFELPQREIGGLLPSWDELVRQTTSVRDTGAAAHLDGARLWESQPFYDRPYAEIAGRFDSVYVSFYKGIGGLAGCCLLGDEALVDEARAWRRRHGGTLFSLWPNAASALVGLRARLPRMAAYRDHAVAVHSALRDVDGVMVAPDPPQTAMFHLQLRTDAERFDAARRRVAEEQKLWLWRASSSSALPGWRQLELTVGDATLAFTPEQVAEVVAALVA